MSNILEGTSPKAKRFFFLVPQGSQAGKLTRARKRLGEKNHKDLELRRKSLGVDKDENVALC